MKVVYILAVAVTVLLFPEYRCIEISGIVDKLIPTPVQCWFHSKDGKYGRENCNKKRFEDGKDNKEHGSLDFFGRDIFRNIYQTFSKSDVEKERPIKFSKVTTGLDCDKTFFSGVVDTFKSVIKAIYPGTKWCGDGNISGPAGELGKYYLTDRCCKEHDLCFDNIGAGKTRYGLSNTGLFTRSHCDCDRRFYECLKEADTFVANSIGFTYFNVLGPQCFQEDFEIISCFKMYRGKCLRYRLDPTSEKLYQWFDSPKY